MRKWLRHSGQPFAEGFEALHLDSRNSPVNFPADIEEKVAVLTQNVDRQIDEFVGDDGLRFPSARFYPHDRPRPRHSSDFLRFVCLRVEYSGEVQSECEKPKRSSTAPSGTAL